MTAKKRPTLDDVAQWRDQAVKEWIDEHGSKEIVKRKVFDLLDSQRDDIVCKLVGFDNRWGSRGWEIDHCNGRQSAVLDFIRENAKAGIYNWIKAKVGDIHEVKLTKSAIQSIEKEYQEMLVRHMREYARKLAAEQATIQINQMFQLELPVPCIEPNEDD